MPWERIAQARTTLPRGVPRTPAEGRWFDVDETVVLRSGERDEWHDRVVELAKELGVIPRSFRGRFDTARHVETKLAVRMRYEQRTEEVVLIDRPVCGTNTWDQGWPATCDKVLRRFLPPGGILRVVQWDGTVRTYRGQETDR